MQWDAFLQAIHRKLRSVNPSEKVYIERNENEIISLISKNPEIEELISAWLEDRFKKKNSKSSARARESKNAGNIFFKKSDFVKSLFSYSESAKFSSADGEDFAVAIANRSACLFHMCRYQECLADIEVAITAGYPKKLRHKVLLRAAHCHIKLRNAEAAEESITKAKELINYEGGFSKFDQANLLKQMTTLSSDIKKILPSPKSSDKPPAEVMTPDKLMEVNMDYPSASPSLTRSHSPSRGRFVIATKPIKKGAILFVEKPFAFVPLSHETSSSTCGHCCGELSEVSYPCRSCVKLSYCSPECWRESWNQYHRWECPGYDMGIWEQIGIAHLAIKVFLVSATSQDVSKFMEVQRLVTHIEDWSDDDLMVYSITAIALAQYLDEHTSFLTEIDLKKSVVEKFTSPEKGLPFAISTGRERKRFVACLLLRHMLQLIANGHAITRLNLMNAQKGDVVDEQQQRVAVGIYPSVSMMNHSCDPTIINTFWNDYLIVKSMKNVEIGEEIFNSYGAHFRRMSLEERQNALSQYHFQCKCPPCTNPALQCFLDRFTALKCPSCSGPLQYLDVVFKCMECHKLAKIHVISIRRELERAEDLFSDSQELLDLGKIEESKEKILQCLKIRKNFLYIHHEDITMALDALGKLSAMMGQWLDAISYLEESLVSVEERFGAESIEVVNELNKITDVCGQYVHKELKRRSETYKNVLKKLHRFLERGVEITQFLGGPWDRTWREFEEKKEDISGIFESLHISI